VREGRELAIVAIGSTVGASLEAAERLVERGINASVANARFVKPLDEDLLYDLCRRFGKILIVEDNVLEGGFGSAVLEFLQGRDLHSIEVKRLGVPDVFIEHGTQNQLRQKYEIDSTGIFNRIVQWVERENSRPSSKQRIPLDLRQMSNEAQRTVG
jgi:1-deoxy-D-xylulose-5-phosphate synthase